MARPKILIIDDEQGVLDSLSEILDMKGYEVRTARDASYGVALVSKYYYDVVLLDIVMPEMNGVEAFRHIRRTSPSSSVIMMTGYGAGNPLVRSAIDNGIKLLLHKPFHVSALFEAIDSALAHQLCVYQMY